MLYGWCGKKNDGVDSITCCSFALPYISCSFAYFKLTISVLNGGTGLLLWNQTRQRWVGNNRSENRAQQIREPKLRLIALKFIL